MNWHALSEFSTVFVSIGCEGDAWNKFQKKKNKTLSMRKINIDEHYSEICYIWFAKIIFELRENFVKLLNKSLKQKYLIQSFNLVWISYWFKIKVGNKNAQFSGWLLKQWIFSRRWNFTSHKTIFCCESSLLYISSVVLSLLKFHLHCWHLNPHSYDNILLMLELKLKVWNKIMNYV